MNYRVDYLVEVMKQGKGFEVSYFCGQIIEDLGDRFLIKYDLLDDEDNGGPLQEIVEEEDLRPAAFVFEAYLDEGDIVDAFYKNGFRKGVITELIEEEDGNFALVFFEKKKKNKYKRFPFGHIRIHQEFDPINVSWTYVKKYM